MPADQPADDKRDVPEIDVRDLIGDADESDEAPRPAVDSPGMPGGTAGTGDNKVQDELSR